MRIYPQFAARSAAGNSMSRSFTLLGAGVLLAACGDQPAAPLGPEEELRPAFSAASHDPPAMVNWHAQQAVFGKTGPVEGASAHLVRNANGLSFRMTTNSLTAGNAFTLWLVVVNNPEACATTPCSGPDIFFNEDTDSQVRYAAGLVAGASGRGTFAGSVTVGPLSGWLPDRSFENPMGVEVHLVINDHGPMLPEFMPGMIHTFRGGCSNDSPFPAIFPDTALADGEVGPNICRLYQVAVLLAP